VLLCNNNRAAQTLTVSKLKTALNIANNMQGSISEGDAKKHEHISEAYDTI